MRAALLVLGWLLLLGALPVRAAPAGDRAPFEEALAAAAGAPTEAQFRTSLERALALLPPDSPPEIQEALAGAQEAAWPFQARDAVARASALRQGWKQAHAFVPAPAVEARAGRERLQAILARPEFTRASWAHNLLARLDDWLQDLLQRLFSSAGLSEAAADRLARILLWTLGVLVALGWAVAMVAVIGVLRRRPGSPAPAPAGPESPHEGRERPALGWLAAAESEAARGDHRMALRYAYLALLRRLDEREVLRLDRDRTNWELVRQAPEGPVREDLTSATRLFESRWYAGRPAAAEEYRTLRETCSRWA